VNFVSFVFLFLQGENSFMPLKLLQFLVTGGRNPLICPLRN